MVKQPAVDRHELTASHSTVATAIQHDGEDLPALPSQGPNLKEQAVVAIRSAIVFGRLKPDRLYAVNYFASQLGISRTPTREALLELASQGLVEPVRYRGFKLVRPSLEEVHGLIEVRRLLEVPGHEDAVGRATPRDLRRVEQDLRRLETAAEERDLGSFLMRDREFHLRIMEIGPNPWFARLVGRLRDQATLREPGQIRNYLHDANAEHQAMLSALRDGNAPSMGRLVRAHLDDLANRWVGTGSGDVAPTDGQH